MLRRTILKFAAALAIAISTAPLHAQTYPNKSIRFIVPYPPGGGADIACRIIAQKLQENLGQPVLVENRPGASEIIGNDAIAKAAPDGYTMGFISSALAINAALQARLPFDPERDIIPVTRLLNVHMIMAVTPSLPVNSVKELVALAKAQPGRLNYGSLGPAGPHALIMEWFKSLTGTNIVAITYKGVAPAMTALAVGEVQVTLTALTAGSAQIKAGKIRAIGVTAAAGAPGAPDIPPIARDYPEMDISSWYGLGVPSGTPGDIVVRIHSEVTRVLNAPDIRQRFDALGVETAPMPQEAFAAMLRNEKQLWARVIKSSGLKSD